MVFDNYQLPMCLVTLTAKEHLLPFFLSMLELLHIHRYYTLTEHTIVIFIKMLLCYWGSRSHINPGSSCVWFKKVNKRNG